MGAIPKRVLIHSATLKSVVRDAWQNEISSTDTALTNIRIEQSNKMVQTKDNQERQLNAIVFYDIVNSRPKNVVFAQDDIITIGGIDRRIHLVRPEYDSKKLHHYEVEVI